MSTSSNHEEDMRGRHTWMDVRFSRGVVELCVECGLVHGRLPGPYEDLYYESYDDLIERRGAARWATECSSKEKHEYFERLRTDRDFAQAEHDAWARMRDMDMFGWPHEIESGKRLQAERDRDETNEE